MTTPDPNVITEIEQAYATARGLAPYQVNITEVPEYLETVSYEKDVAEGLLDVVSQLQDMREQLTEARDLFKDFIENFDARLAAVDALREKFETFGARDGGC